MKTTMKIRIQGRDRLLTTLLVGTLLGTTAMADAGTVGGGLWGQGESSTTQAQPRDHGFDLDTDQDLPEHGNFFEDLRVRRSANAFGMALEVMRSLRERNRAAEEGRPGGAPALRQQGAEELRRRFETESDQGFQHGLLVGLADGRFDTSSIARRLEELEGRDVVLTLAEAGPEDLSLRGFGRLAGMDRKRRRYLGVHRVIQREALVGNERTEIQELRFFDPHMSETSRARVSGMVHEPSTHRLFVEKNWLEEAEREGGVFACPDAARPTIDGVAYVQVPVHGLGVASSTEDLRDLLLAQGMRSRKRITETATETARRAKDETLGRRARRTLESLRVESVNTVVPFVNGAHATGEFLWSLNPRVKGGIGEAFWSGGISTIGRNPSYRAPSFDPVMQETRTQELEPAGEPSTEEIWGEAHQEGLQFGAFDEDDFR